MKKLVKKSNTNSGVVDWGNEPPEVVTYIPLGLYVNKVHTEEYEVWLAPECPYNCENCTFQDLFKAHTFRPEDKFKIKKIIFKDEEIN